MKITFQKIRFKNFLSFGNNWTELDLQKYPNAVILGKNGNGKSTITDSICFALYGKPYRKINKPQLINSINDKNLLVEIFFKIGSNSYMIRRGLKPSIFEIYVNENLIPQDSKSIDYQSYLEKNILRMSFKSFCQIVIIGSSSWTPFMQLPTGQRREIIEDLLDQQIFTKMNSVLSNKFSELKAQEYENEKQYEIISEKIKLHQKNIIETNKNIEEEIKDTIHYIEENKRELENVKKYILEKNKELEKTKKLQNIYNDLEEKRKLLENEILKIENKIQQHEKEISFYEKNNYCPKCNNEMNDNFRKKEISLIQEKIENEIIKLDDLKDQKKQIESNENFENRYNNIVDLTTELRASKEFFQTVKNRISFFENKKESIYKRKDENKKLSEKDLSELKNSFIYRKNEKEQLENKKELYKDAQLLLKDNGIKSKIISKTIPIINKLVNKYLEHMDMFVSFELDESFNETIKSRFLESYSYNNFSEGEKSRINLALLFAWREIAKMRNSTITNLLILDEIFDGPLDNEGSEIFANIIKGLTFDNNVFIITHNEVMFDKFTTTIKVNKKNNFSYIE